MTGIIVFRVDSSPIGYYYTFIYLLMAAASYFLWKRSPDFDYKDKLSKRNKILLACLMLFLLILILYLSQSHFTWVDEYSQATLSLYNPIQGAISQQQPAMGYIFTHYVFKYFGFTLFNLRLLAIIPFVCSIYVLSRTLLSLRRNMLSVFLLCFLFYMNGIMSFVSMEARPLALSILGLSVIVASITHFLDPRTQRHWSIFIQLICSFFFFLNTLGFQPIVLSIFTIILFMTCGLLLKNKKFSDISIAGIFSLILFYPIQISNSSVAREMGFLKSNPLKNIFSLPQDFSTNLLEFWSIGYSGLLIFFFFALIIFSYFSTARKNKLKAVWLICFCLYLLFPPICYWVYHIFIDWFLSIRYFSTYIALSIFLFILGLSSLNQKINHIFYISTVVAVLFFSNKSSSYLQSANMRLNWGQTLKENTFPLKDLRWRGYMLGTCQYDDSLSCSDVFVGAEFFLSSIQVQNLPSRFLNNSFFRDQHLIDNGMLHDFVYPFSDKRIIISFSKYYDDVDINTVWPEIHQESSSFHSNGFSAKRKNNFIIVQSSEPLGAKEGIKKFLEWQTIHMPKTLAHMYPYELLIRIYMLEGETAKADSLLKRITEMPNFSIQYTLKRRFRTKIEYLAQLINSAVKRSDISNDFEQNGNGSELQD